MSETKRILLLVLLLAIPKGLEPTEKSETIFFLFGHRKWFLDGTILSLSPPRFSTLINQVC